MCEQQNVEEKHTESNATKAQTVMRKAVPRQHSNDNKEQVSHLRPEGTKALYLVDIKEQVGTVTDLQTAVLQPGTKSKVKK